jgi:hypothetical protein
MAHTRRPIVCPTRLSSSFNIYDFFNLDFFQVINFFFTSSLSIFCCCPFLPPSNYWFS